MYYYPYIILGLCLVILICGGKGMTFNTTDNDVISKSKATLQAFKHFMTLYNKTYASPEELTARYDIFTQSVERHRLLNAARTHPQDAVYGVTQFSDLTPQEFSALVLGHRSSFSQTFLPINQKVSFQANLKDVPPKHDWRSHKPPVLTQVRDQGTCGGCWAFSVVESMETQYALKTGKLLELSPQQLIDCAGIPEDQGCNGGSICGTLAWLNDTQQPIVTEKVYPFKDHTEPCKHINSTSGSVRVSNFTCQSYVNNEDAMVSMLYNHGVLSVAVDATSWQDYMGGIIQHHCYDKYDNHAVQIVGYDKTGVVPFYIVRNSWGNRWGLKGYLNIKIGNNLCGIANTVASVNVWNRR